MKGFYKAGDNRYCNIDNFIMEDRNFFEDLYLGRLKPNEHHLLMILRERANCKTARGLASYSGFKRYIGRSANTTKDAFMGLKKKSSLNLLEIMYFIK